MTTPAGHFDARPLLDPIDPVDQAAFARALKAAHPQKGGIAGWVVMIVVLVLFVMPILFVTLMGLGYVIGRGAGAALAGLFAIALTAALVVGGILVARRAIAAREAAQYRLSRFATANGLSYIPAIEAPPLPGMIFSHGTGRRSTDVLRGLQPRFVEFGNYQFTTSSGKNSQTHHYGYVAVKLDVPLPHIILDARSNNVLGSGLSFSFASDQRLSLEGDFDQYFSLFCPRDYEVDALYLFTPDVMARFIDHAAQLDVEIVDDWMFLYVGRPASTLDPATWAWLFGAVGALLTKLDQWARWRDERLRGQTAPVAPLPAASAPPVPGVPAPAGPGLPFAPPSALLTPPPPGVAPPGRRLRSKSPWMVIALVLGIVFGMPVLLFSAMFVIFLAGR